MYCLTVVNFRDPSTVIYYEHMETRICKLQRDYYLIAPKAEAAYCLMYIEDSIDTTSR